MRIISTSPESTALSQTPDILSVERLLKHHPATILFDVSLAQYSSEGATFEFKLRDVCTGARSNVSSFAGCMIDLAVRAVAGTTLGNCELSEYEIHIYAPLSAKPLQVYVHIESTMERCATFCCTIRSTATHKNILLAESQGTLLSRAPSLQAPNKHFG